MIGISLLEEMSKHKDITFLPDSRSIKVESGNSLHDYLQTQLWFPMKSESIITTRPCSSDANRNIQFSDMLSGIVQGHFEDGNSQPWEKIKTNINCQTLFFWNIISTNLLTYLEVVFALHALLSQKHMILRHLKLHIWTVDNQALTTCKFQGFSWHLVSMPFLPYHETIQSL